MPAPDRVLIPWDEDYGRFQTVGVTEDGRKFIVMVTGAFPADNPFPGEDWEELKRWYAVLHLFDADGNHLSTTVRNGGTTADGEKESIERARAFSEEMLDGLGFYEFEEIEIGLFEHSHEGYPFGLVFREADPDDLEDGDDPEEFESVEFLPCDLVFYPPYDDGEYDT